MSSPPVSTDFLLALCRLFSFSSRLLTVVKNSAWRMIRRCVRLLCENDGRADLPGGMPLLQALSIFGFTLQDKIEKSEIKKRYAKLALKHHPDRGGSSETFQQIVAAQKTLMSVRHDQHTERPKVEFRKHTPNSYDTAMRKEERQFGRVDTFFFIVMLSGLVSAYVWKVTSQHTSVLRKRRNMLPEEVQEIENPKKPEDVWHPWHADSDLKSNVEELAVIQGVVRREVLDERREQLEYVHNHPLAPARLLR
jgi:hypothetical protein